MRIQGNGCSFHETSVLESVQQHLALPTLRLLREIRLVQLDTRVDVGVQSVLPLVPETCDPNDVAI